MPRLVNRNPKYCRHRSSGQAVVYIDSRPIYLGRWSTKASKQEYDRVVSVWLANGRKMPEAAMGDQEINELLNAFWKYAQVYYKSASGHVGEVGSFRLAIRPLRKLYGNTPVVEFGPLALKSVRSEMIRLGWCRRYVNRQIGRLKQIFKWGTENELVPGSVHLALSAVAGLREGKTEAPESEPVRPVAVEFVETTLKFVAPSVAAMVRLQLLTGMRPGEVCIIRGCDIDTTGTLWTYKPATHKTQHHGHERTIYFGERCKEIIKPFLQMNMQDYLFTPRDAARWHSARVHAARRTPMNQGNRPGTNRVKYRRMWPGRHYTTSSYRRAIWYACGNAFPAPYPVGKGEGETIEQWQARLTPELKQELFKWRRAHEWHPHQLRHTFGTFARKEYGLEAAQVLLGHKTLTVTQVYAEKNVAAAMRVMEQVG